MALADAIVPQKPPQSVARTFVYVAEEMALCVAKPRLAVPSMQVAEPEEGLQRLREASRLYLAQRWSAAWSPPAGALALLRQAQMP
jgi:hypothetical protein